MDSEIYLSGRERRSDGRDLRLHWGFSSGRICRFAMLLHRFSSCCMICMANISPTAGEHELPGIFRVLTVFSTVSPGILRNFCSTARRIVVRSLRRHFRTSAWGCTKVGILFSLITTHLLLLTLANSESDLALIGTDLAFDPTPMVSHLTLYPDFGVGSNVRKWRF